MRWVSPWLAVLMGTAKQCVEPLIYLKMLRTVQTFIRGHILCNEVFFIVNSLFGIEHL